MAVSTGIQTEVGHSGTPRAILDASEFLFQRQGYHGTSMRQLARYAGITPAAIYNHYPSKEALFVALLRARLPHRALGEAVLQAEGTTPEDLLRDGVHRMQAALEGRYDQLRLVFIELLEFEGRHFPEVLPEVLAPAQAFILRLQASDPRVAAWPASLILRVVGGAFFAIAASRAFLSQVEGFEADPAAFEAVASILSAGLLHGAEADPGRSPR
jgi:AcrR family transcriptional regulator